MKARINGVASQMKTFDYYFGICLGHLILKHSDNLSRALQKSDISASEGQEVASMTLKVLKSIRSDDMFKLLWERFVKRLNILVFHHQVYHVVVKLLEVSKKEMQRVNTRGLLQTYLLRSIGSHHHFYY